VCVYTVHVIPVRIGDCRKTVNYGRPSYYNDYIVFVRASTKCETPARAARVRGWTAFFVGSPPSGFYRSAAPPCPGPSISTEPVRTIPIKLRRNDPAAARCADKSCARPEPIHVCATSPPHTHIPPLSHNPSR